MENKIVTATSVVEAERIAKHERLEKLREKIGSLGSQGPCQHHWGQIVEASTGRVVGKGCRKCGKTIKK